MKIGDFIKIIDMKGEPQYKGETGRVTHIDAAGQLHGTWGSLAIIPGEDTFEVGKICCVCDMFYFGYGNNAEPLKKGLCCDKCNLEVIKERMMRR